MIVYHADTHCCLQEGQILNLNPALTPIYHLYPNGVSSYADRAFLKPENEAQQAMQIIDTVFDYVRCIHFPDKPSRFTSVFASACLEDSRTWLEEIAGGSVEDTHGCLSTSISGIPIYEVEGSSVYIADARFLDCGNVLQDTPFSLSTLFPFALAYWQSVQLVDIARLGSMRQSYRKPELLLPPPVRVLRRVYP